MKRSDLEKLRDHLEAAAVLVEQMLAEGDTPRPSGSEEAFFKSDLIPQLKVDEGLRLEAYPDPLSGGDPWTIGYGHTGPEVKRGLVWTQEQAEDALIRDALEHGRELERHEPWIARLDPVRRAVLWNMAYNLGVGFPPSGGKPGKGLRSFVNTLAKVRNGDYAGAAKGMLASRWATQVGARAQRLAVKMENGR